MTLYVDFLYSENGQKAINFQVGSDLQGRHPRSVLGYNDNEVILATVDGRKKW